MSATQTREITTTLRTVADSDGRTVTGIAVPLDTPTTLWTGWQEIIARGAVDVTGPMPSLCWRHAEPIGAITQMRETSQGLEITARISDTVLGRDAATLVKDGAVHSLSIGFREIEWTDTQDENTITRTQTRIDLREVSIVVSPAYADAQIKTIREEPTMPTTAPASAPAAAAPAPAPAPVTATDLDRLRTETTEQITGLSQSLDLLRTTMTAPASPTTDARTPGQFLKDLARGDESTIRAADSLLARAWDGTKLDADPTNGTPAWVGDLTRLYNKADPIKGLFATGALPAEGMTLEYAELDTNSVTVGKQAKEGDPLPLGKVTLRTGRAEVETHGGYTSLSRQAIERSRVNLLDHHLQALTLAAAAHSAAHTSAVYAAAVKSRAAAALSVTKAATALTWADLAGLVVDAAAAFTDQALTLDGLVVDKTTFKALASLTGSDGRPLMSVSGTGANTSGTMSLTTLTGSLVGLSITPNLRQQTGDLGAGVVGCFYNSRAIRTYETGLVQLQDENVTNLTKDYSVYRYSAVAVEIPGALVPLKIGA